MEIQLEGRIHDFNDHRDGGRFHDFQRIIWVITRLSFSVFTRTEKRQEKLEQEDEEIQEDRWKNSALRNRQTHENSEKREVGQSRKWIS